MPSAELTVVLIALAPLLAALLAPAIFRFTGALAGWVLAIVPAAIFIYLFTFVPVVAEHGFVRAALPWVPAYGIVLSFFVDGLSLTFAMLISGIGTLIVIYAGASLAGHPHQGRFFAFLLAFMGAMLGLVLADNLLALFTFWELTSITSFLLIGFDHTRQAARRAAIQAIVVTGFGGLALLAAFVLLHLISGTWEISALRGFGPLLRETPFYGAILCLVLVGAFTKSAQFPFHSWLANAMEAPTPVSAFLHSATMVQAGVYLLARLHPVLGGTMQWHVVLPVIGGITLLWGAFNALRQTDLKQMLAHTTVASLGLLVLLLGVGTGPAIAAAMAYIVAHALYKAALFMLAGAVDHATGTREVTLLGGLGRAMPATFLLALLGGLSMAGLPATLGFLAKEEVLAGLLTDRWPSLFALAATILASALMMAVAGAIALGVFLGPARPTPLQPREAGPGLLLGPAVLVFAGVAGAFLPGLLGPALLAPAASTVFNAELASHLGTGFDPLSLAFGLSLITWALGALAWWRLDAIRGALRRLGTAVDWTFDTVFDALMFGLVRGAFQVTRLWHHGRLELYLFVLFAGLALALLVPLALLGGLPALPSVPVMALHEWAVVVVAALGVLAVVFIPSRLAAIMALGIQGFGVAMIYMLNGAPDLAFTQFMVETLSVVILALVMTRLRLDERDPRVLENVLRDGALALICGGAATVLLLAVLSQPLDLRLSDFFVQTSAAIAHGRNIVNVILVDHRGIDTWGEITVVMTAGLAIIALIRFRPAPPAREPVRRRRSRKAAT